MPDAFDLASRLLDRWLEKVGPDGKARLHKHGCGKRIRIHSTANSIDLLLDIGEERVSIHPTPYTPAGHEAPGDGNYGGTPGRGGNYAGTRTGDGNYGGAQAGANSYANAQGGSNNYGGGQGDGNYAGSQAGGGNYGGVQGRGNDYAGAPGGGNYSGSQAGGGNYGGVQGAGAGATGGQTVRADLDIEFNLAILTAPALGLGAAQWRERGWLRINGDVNFAEKLLDISGDMPAGLGDAAQPFIGKTGALMLDRLIEFIRDVFGRAINNLRMDVVDFLQYQGDILTDPASINEFNELTEQLMREIDTLETRLNKLDSKT